MLPNLPKQNKQCEASFGLKFRAWHKKNPIHGVFELKYAKDGKVLAFDALAPEQIAYGLEIKRVGRLVRVVGSVGEPDYAFMKGPAYVVVRYASCFTIIDIDVWVNEKTVSERKSLTVLRAREVATIVVEC